MKTNADMTLYNRRTDGGKETFVRTVIYGVSWNARYKTALTDKGLMGAQEVSVRIPWNATAGIPDGRKTYIAPELYDAASPDEHITFCPGDWSVKGIVEGDLSDVAKNNPSACVIKSAADNRDPRLSKDMQHWRVMG